MDGLDEAMPLGWDAAAAAASAATAETRRGRRPVRHVGRAEDSRAADIGSGVNGATNGAGGSTAPTASDDGTSPKHRHQRSARASSVDVNPPASPRLDELPSAQKPRMTTKRGRDTDESDDESDASVSDGGGHDASDYQSEAARRVAKRMRGTEWAGGEIGESEAARCRQDPARRLMVEARAATLTHNLAMTMERKMAVRAGQSSGDAGGESGSERGSTTATDGLRWSGPGKSSGSGGGGGGSHSDHLPGQRWSHGGRSPSPTPSTMSGCSVAANAPLSPSGGSDLSSSSMYLRAQAHDPVHGYSHGPSDHSHQDQWVANGTDTDPEELLLGAEAAMHPDPNPVATIDPRRDGAPESNRLSSALGGSSSSSSSSGSGHRDASSCASTGAAASGARLAGSEGSSLDT